MSQLDNRFDELLRGQMEGLESSVSSADWDAIVNKLDAVEEKKAAPVWWPYLAAGIVVLVGGLFWLLTPSSDLDSGDAVVNHETPAVIETPSSTNDSEQSDVVENIKIPTNEAQAANRANQPNTPNERTDVQRPEPNVPAIPVGDAGDVVGETPGITTPSNDREIANEDSDKPDESNPKEIAQDDNQETANPDKDLPTNVDNNKPGVTSNKDEGRSNPGFSTSSNGSWELGVSFTPNWASKIIRGNGDLAWRINPRFDEITKAMETGSYSYQLNVDVNRYFGKNWFISSGLTYNQVEESVSYDYLVDGFYDENVNQKTLDFVPWNPSLHYRVNYTGINQYRYLQIPLQLGFVDTLNVKGRQFKIKVESGVQYMGLLGMTGMKLGVTDIRELEDLSTQVDNYSRNNIGANTSIGLYWIAGPRMDLGFSGFGSLALSSIRSKNEAIKERPYNTGLHIGLNYKLLTNKR